MILLLPLPNSFYTFGLGTFYSPCLQLSDQFNWFTLQLLTTSGYVVVASHYYLISSACDLTMHTFRFPCSTGLCLRIYGAVSAYLLPSNKYLGRELHVILSIHSLYVGANGFV